MSLLGWAEESSIIQLDKVSEIEVGVLSVTHLDKILGIEAGVLSVIDLSTLEAEAEVEGLGMRMRKKFSSVLFVIKLDTQRNFVTD